MSTPGTGPDTRSKRGRELTHERRAVLVFTFAMICATAVGCGPLPRGTIGAVLLRKEDGRVIVRDVPPHLAAARAGVLPGDELLLIEGQDVRRLGEDDLRRVLSGYVGEPVRLTFVRGEQVRRVTIQRSMAEPYRVQ